MEKPTHRSLSWKASQKEDFHIPKGKNYLFAVGIDRYTHLPPLANAVSDAKEAISVLTGRYQFNPNDVISLFDSDATERNIRIKLDWLVDHVKSDDNLIIYFSGHGQFNSNRKRGYWIPVDAELDHTADYIDNSVIKDYILDIKSRHTFLVSDSCYSGSFFRRTRGLRKEAMPPNPHYKKIEYPPSRWALMSGGLEKVLDGREGSSSPFNRGFIDCLKYNLEPHLSVLELITKVQKAVGNNVDQQPIGNRIYGVEDFGQGQFVFHLKEEALPKAKQIEVTELPPKPESTPQIRSFYTDLPKEKTVNPPPSPVDRQPSVPSEILGTGRPPSTAPEDQQAEELINKAIAAIRKPEIEEAEQMFIPLIHSSFCIDGYLKERFYNHNFLVAFKKIDEYVFPIQLVHKKTSNRTRVGSRSLAQNGKEIIYTLAEVADRGTMPGSIRVFFPKGGGDPIISGTMPGSIRVFFPKGGGDPIISGLSL